jgi:phospholipid/cholesterol/gamma-HCH transport system substrate-binding protein
MLDENRESLHNAIKNIETFTDALARNSEKLDTLVSDTTDAVQSYKKLADNLDRRTASITTGVNKLTDTATKHIDIVGNDAHRAIQHIDTAITDLAKHPQRILFGGGGG